MGKLSFILVFFTCLAVAFGSKGQTDSTIHLSQQQLIQGDFTNFYIDNLGNVYLLNANNQIKKINDKGDSVAVANALKRFGDIYSMDVSNSLKVVVYYKDFTTIVVLDRFLKNVNTIDLRKYEILQARSVAISYDNNYWVFDEVENKLKKIDDYGNILLSTPDLRMVFDESFLPEKIIDYNGYVYLYNKIKGCKIFDYYGALKQSIPLPDQNNIQVFKNSILGFADSTIHVYDISAFTEHSYLLDPQVNNALKLQKLLNSLYVLKRNGLYIYTINN